jgi:hypothetical protein
MLLKVPLTPSTGGTRKALCTSGLSDTQEGHYQRSDVVRCLAEQGVMLAVCQSQCGRTYAINAFTPVEDQP